MNLTPLVANGGILSRRDGYLKSGNWVQADESNGTLVNPVSKWITAATWSAYSSSQRIAVVSASKSLRFAYANGQLIGQTDQAGAKLDAVTRLTAYDSSDLGAGEVMVQEGDTLKSIAQRVYGEENLWYVLADANAIDDDSQLVAGTTLKAPKVTTHQNDATTFKPYDPNQVIGPTAPGLPYIAPPPKNHCSALAMIVIVVVAVIVTIYTAGAAAGAMGATTGATASGTAAAGAAAGGAGAAAGGFGATMATGVAAMGGSFGIGTAIVAGAAGGFAGSLAGQALGSALGVGSFSWKQVAVDTVTAAATAGAGAYLKGVSALRTTAGGLNAAGRAAQAVAGYGGTVIGNTIVGRDANFSWSAVAQTAVGAYISANIGGQLPITKSGSPGGQFLNNFGGLFLDGAANTTVARMFGGPEQDWGKIATDAFGNALANAAVQGAMQWQANRALAQQQMARGARAVWADGNPFNDGRGAVGVDVFDAEDGSFLERYPYATASLANGDVRRSNAINTGLANQLLEQANAPRHDAGGPQMLETIRVTGSKEPLELDIVGGRVATPADIANDALIFEAFESGGQLPQLENMYDPYEGWWSGKFNTFSAMFDDPSGSWLQKAGGVAGGVLTFIPAMADMIIEGVYNAPNNAALAGQKWAQASRLNGPDAVLAYAQGTQYLLAGFQGLGNVATLGATTAIKPTITPAVTTLGREQVTVPNAAIPNVDDYVASLYSKATPTSTNAGLFEVEQTGPLNYRVVGGNTAIDIDGYHGTTMLDAKYVGDLVNSPYVDGSKIPPFLQNKILAQQQYEFQRYEAVIADPSVPFDSLNILTNEPYAVPYFQRLMNQYQIPGEVQIVPSKVPQVAPLRP